RCTEPCPYRDGLGQHAHHSGAEGIQRPAVNVFGEKDEPAIRLEGHAVGLPQRTFDAVAGLGRQRRPGGWIQVIFLASDFDGSDGELHPMPRRTSRGDREPLAKLHVLLRWLRLCWHTDRMPHAADNARLRRDFSYSTSD